jgi:hypothetical protein
MHSFLGIKQIQIIISVEKSDFDKKTRNSRNNGLQKVSNRKLIGSEMLLKENPR